MIGNAAGDSTEEWVTNGIFEFPGLKIFIGHLFGNQFFRTGPNDYMYISEPFVSVHRNPWDTMVSYWKHWMHRGYLGDGEQTLPKDTQLSDFLRSPHFGIEAWSEWQYRHDVLFKEGVDMRVTYQQMLDDPHDVLERVCHWIMPSADWDIERGVKNGSFDEMRKSKAKHLQRIDPFDPESGKLRRGKNLGFVDYMSDEDIKFIADSITEEQFARHSWVLKGADQWSKA